MGEVLSDAAEAAGLARLAALAAREAALFAARCEQLCDSARLSERLCGAGGPERFLVLDLARTLRVGQGAAGHQLADARRLEQVLTGTLGGLRDGRVFVPQARVVLEQTRTCTEQVAAEVDRRLHAAAPDGLADWTGRRLSTRLGRLVCTVEGELEPAATAERERTARQGRRVSVRPEPDAMASLWALLPADRLRAFTVGLEELARREKLADRAAGVERTADQRRADVLAMLPELALRALDGGPGGTSPVGGAGGHRTVVVVHVPLATALGVSQAPGDLDGYGPISAGHARALLPTAHLRRLVVDDRTGQPLFTRTTPTIGPERPAASGPATGTAAPAARAAAAAQPGGRCADDPVRAPVRRQLQRLLEIDPLQVEDLLEVDETQHDPSAPLARFVRLRDPLCTGPGCSTHSGDSDLDHETPWPHGPTSGRNLGPKSRRCHRAKTLTWTVTRDPDGSRAWKSPTGSTYTVPPYWDPPPAPRPPRHPPDQPPDQPVNQPPDRPPGGRPWAPRGLPADLGLAAQLQDAVQLEDAAPRPVPRHPARQQRDLASLVTPHPDPTDPAPF